MQKCNGCEQIKAEPITIPYTVMEAEQTRAERTNKRLWILCIILIALLLITNGLWMWYESRFETVECWEQEVQQEADEGENAFYGGDYYGETND